MALSPLDILQKQFGPARRQGYEPEEVQKFLDGVREAWEGTLKELARTREESRLLADEIDRLRAQQDEIRETLILARRISADLEGTARREADIVIGEARLDAERIMASAHEEHRTLQEQVVRLKATRLQLAGDLRVMLNGHLQMLESLE